MASIEPPAGECVDPTRIALSGDIRIRTVGELKATLEQLGSVNGDVVIDCDELQAIDCAVLQILDAARRDRVSRGATLTLANASTEIVDALVHGGFAQCFTIE